MTQAKCFECRKDLPMGKSMEELLKDEFPVFCSTECSVRFPDNGTDLFNAKMDELRDLW